MCERLTILTSGNVGIGINPTSTFFQVSGNSTDNIAWFNNTQSNGYASARFYNNCNKAAVFGVGGSAVSAPYTNNGYIYTDSGVDLAFTMGGTERMRITSTGIACFACQVCAPSGVKFGSGATTLNYYEEGTFTPTIQGLSTAGTGTYSHQIGVYTKIGNLVTINVWINWSAHTGTGDLLLAGFPFTSIGTTNYRASGTFGWVQNLTLSASNVVTMAMTPSSTNASVTQYTVGGGAASSVSMDASANLHFSITYQTS